jgi:hypothetical protein
VFRGDGSGGLANCGESSGGISLLKHEPSAQMPWQNTMLGLFDAFILVTPFDGEAMLAARPVPATSSWRRVGLDRPIAATALPTS